MRIIARLLTVVTQSAFLLAFFMTNAHAVITVTDEYGEHSFEQAPQRVVALNWDILEQVLALNVEPIAAPNLPATANGSSIQPHQSQLKILGPEQNPT